METKMCVREKKHLNNIQALNNFKLKCAQKNSLSAFVCNPVKLFLILQISTTKPEDQVIFGPFATKKSSSSLKHHFFFKSQSMAVSELMRAKVLGSLHFIPSEFMWYKLQVQNILIRESLTVPYTPQPFYHTIQRAKKYAFCFKGLLFHIYCLQSVNLPPPDKRIWSLGTALNWKQVIVEDRQSRCITGS